MARHFVRVYDGEGSSPNALSALYRSLKEALVDTSYTVQKVRPEILIEGQWEQDTALLAFGGGYDLGYQRALGKIGMDRIKHYVQQGGSYFGLCAGGYFGSDFVEFDKGGPLEVCGYRHLTFYPGKCVGPAFPGYKYNSETGARAVKINWLASPNGENADVVSEESDFNWLVNSEQDGTDEGSERSVSDPPTTCYYNGGGYFFSSEHLDGDRVRSLAIYAELPNKPPAIVLCRPGKGTAILTGIHPEFTIKDLNENQDNTREIINLLKEQEHKCKQIFYRCLQMLGLKFSIKSHSNERYKKCKI